MPIFKVSAIFKILLVTNNLVIIMNKRSKNVEIVQRAKNESKYRYLLTKDVEFYTLKQIT